MYMTIFTSENLNSSTPKMQLSKLLKIVLLSLISCLLFYKPLVAQPSISSEKLIVNDVTQLNPIPIEKIVKPHDIDEIITAVKNSKGPISIGGGRFSMGGQTATNQALQLDMREFNKILNFSQETKEITVQAGTTWRQIQEFIDPYDLSVKIMQTYSNFTVGGSLSVNVHGRYIGQGPLILSVKNIGLVLADGTYLHASAEENADLFYGAIGGYGGIGVITDVTLHLANNTKVHRINKLMPLSEYKDYFFKEIRNNGAVIFHNADIYPDDYNRVRATSYEESDLPLTRNERLIPQNQSYWLDHSLLWMISSLPGGKLFREHIVDPIVYSGERVTWRNYEASYSVLELEPSSRKQSTYVLQEYFVPVDKLNEFVPKMAEILNRHEVNVINISIRHAHQDKGSLLAWAREEVFAFVLYYKQGTNPEAREKVGMWTRELIDAAIHSGGRYYLPYQIHATAVQFKSAYPGWEKYCELKRRVDPDNKFRNKLLDAYFLGTEAEANSEIPNSVKAYVGELKDYHQDEGQTLLTMPEWFLVFSPDEFAHYIEHKMPSGYPYFGAIGQFWNYYFDSAKAADAYPFNTGYHVMLWVIGSSFTIENSIKGLYENIIGRAVEMTLNQGEMTDEDWYSVATAKDYVAFIRVQPWYEYPFWSRLVGLWSETGLTGDHQLRKWERKFILSAEYLIKAIYGGIIKLATKTAYGDAEEKVLAIVKQYPGDAALTKEKVKLVQQFDNGFSVVALPRYEAFMAAAIAMVDSGASFYEIAGNQKILATIISDKAWQPNPGIGTELYRYPVLIDEGKSRIGIVLNVKDLQASLSSLRQQNIILEHIYDY